jgi:hypothetical protein
MLSDDVRMAHDIVVPDATAVAAKLDAICDGVRESVRCQLVWRYRKTLSENLDESTREQEAMRWFSDRWSDATWRLKAVPGKQVLAQLRHWCQQNYSLTLTAKLLLDALDPVPDDLRKSLSAISRLLYPTSVGHG